MEVQHGDCPGLTNRTPAQTTGSVSRAYGPQNKPQVKPRHERGHESLHGILSDISPTAAPTQSTLGTMVLKPSGRDAIGRRTRSQGLLHETRHPTYFSPIRTLAGALTG